MTIILKVYIISYNLDEAFLIGGFHFNKIIRANVSFVVANGVFAFLFSKLPFCIQFLLVIYVLGE